MEKIDSASVIHVPLDIPVDELRDRIASLPRLNFIHVDHAAASRTQTDSIITLARQDPALKEKLVMMANAGFHLYTLREGVSSMVRHRRIPTLWRLAIAGEVAVDSNTIFSKLEAAPGGGEPRLLVVFSSIAGVMYTPSLMRHFEQNFASIGKYVPKNTHIMRIADFGGVVGSFYLNSRALPDNEDHISSRIEDAAAGLGVARDNIVLYGGSKGGTAAAFYAMRHGWRGVAADPILSDEHYLRKYRDLHFTEGTFAATKQERFAELVGQVHPEARLSVICSTRSPQFPYIDETLIGRFRDRFLFLNSENPEIRAHPDVGRLTIPHALAQINQHLAGLAVPGGYHTIW
ncbi:XcbB/CpsF family capsular polysaccharide biosynthesis protein [Paracoccus aminovorans]|uniref:XcbB/CpsF family capsular polysaccharide biosynthesis protein n=1 Tax=Paracoccus aminovorans TaxID=34004 RepID=UPI002B2586F3|nr:XcbB/CpsF family capsular polysaccharide biosynthesis protein [Paracoccus aminovorans]